MADDAGERRLRRHRDHPVDHPGVNLLPLFDAVVEIDEHVAGARRGFGLALDLHPIAARRNIDAEAVFDADQIAVELAKQNAQQLRSLKFRGQSDAVAGFGGGRGGQRAFGHMGKAPRLRFILCTRAKAGVHHR